MTVVNVETNNNFSLIIGNVSGITRLPHLPTIPDTDVSSYLLLPTSYLLFKLHYHIDVSHKHCCYC